MRDRCLFATHADFLNDVSECKLIVPHLTKVLAADYAELTPKLINLKIMRPDMLETHGTNFYISAAENAVHAMLRATNTSAPYYITSFCIHDDEDDEYQNGLLSQWRAYARGGFAIEFDELAIDALNKEESAGWRYQGILTDAVVYKEHESKIEPERFKGMAGAFLRNILPERFLTQRQREADEILGTAAVEQFGHAYLSVAAFLKHPDFSEENEYRIVLLCNRPEVVAPEDKRKAKEIRFRERADGSLTPYIALYEGLKKRLPIKSVIIGPHRDQEGQRLAVELLLEQYGVQAEVRVSSTPFRG
jgi:hypothetical protein